MKMARAPRTLTSDDYATLVIEAVAKIEPLSEPVKLCLRTQIAAAVSTATGVEKEECAKIVEANIPIATLPPLTMEAIRRGIARAIRERPPT